MGKRREIAGWAAVVVGALAQASAFAASPPRFDDLDARAPANATAPQSLAAAAAMIAVPAGAYPMGRDDGPEAQRPAHSVRLDAFEIDRTEVTNAAFAEFLNALDLKIGAAFAAGDFAARHGRGAAARLLRERGEGDSLYPIIALDDDEARIGYRGGRFAPTPGYEDHPAAETTWAGARAYCRWRGARLPTEAEWEAAARGPDARPYPWGDAAPSATRAFVSGRTAVTAPVGGRPDGASPFGVLDMSGSMAEWTSTLRRPYPYVADDGREDPDAPGERVTRGGDYIFDVAADTLTATHRTGFSNRPSRGHRHIGFRCARSAPGA